MLPPPTSGAVLVTGATGFIGQMLVRALLGDGHDVIVLTRDVNKAAALFGDKVRPIASMDALPVDTVVDVIINLAGARILGQRWTDKRKEALRASRVKLTDSVVDWIGRATHKPSVLLSASAIGYYGIQAQDDTTLLDETAPPQPIFMSDLCREWEEAAMGAQRYGVRVERMRFGLVLGKGGALPAMLVPIKLGVGGRLGSGRQALSWIHVDDLIAGIGHCWRHGTGGAANFTAPEVVTQLAFSQTAAHILHRPCFIPAPGWPLRLALGEQADLVLEGQRVTPARLLREGFVFRYPTLDEALRSLR